jgi:hypothetical protein
MRVVAASLAAERFRATRGRWPVDWNEVKDAGCLTTVPIDFFDGQPLRLKVVGDGLLIYSVGLNGKDDGGAAYRADHPWEQDADDIAFRLWNPEARRQLPEALPWPKEVNDPIP